MITRDTEGAAFRQLARIVRAQIDSGQLEPGGRVPSEVALAQEHGISRDTVRRAMALLRAEGRIVVTPGRATRVSDPGEEVTVKVPRGGTVKGRPASPGEQIKFGIGEAVWMFVVEFGGKTTVYAADRTKLTFS